jgi:hypothetical protein
MAFVAFGNTRPFIVKLPVVPVGSGGMGGMGGGDDTVANALWLQTRRERAVAPSPQGDLEASRARSRAMSNNRTLFFTILVKT